jgi:hypothetical protein
MHQQNSERAIDAVLSRTITHAQRINAPMTFKKLDVTKSCVVLKGPNRKRARPLDRIGGKSSFESCPGPVGSKSRPCHHILLSRYSSRHYSLQCRRQTIQRKEHSGKINLSRSRVQLFVLNWYKLLIFAVRTFYQSERTSKIEKSAIEVLKQTLETGL